MSNGVPPVPGMQGRNPTELKGCAFVFTLLLTIFVIIPWMAIERAAHDIKEAWLDHTLTEDSIEFIVLVESNTRFDTKIGKMCQFGDVVAEGKEGQQLRLVTNTLPSPWVTPRYVWIHSGDPTMYDPVYGVFNDLDAVQRWMKQHGYEGDNTQFEFESLWEEERDGRIGHVACPSWKKDRGEVAPHHMGLLMFLDNGYRIEDGYVYPEQTEFHNVYRQLPRED